jgi:hypothetical protein
LPSFIAFLLHPLAEQRRFDMMDLGGDLPCQYLHTDLFQEIFSILSWNLAPNCHERMEIFSIIHVCRQVPELVAERKKQSILAFHISLQQHLTSPKLTSIATTQIIKASRNNGKKKKPHTSPLEARTHALA